MTFTALERAILRHYHEAYSDRGFPGLEALRVRRREETELGCLVYLQALGRTDLPDWQCLLPENEALVVELPDGGELTADVYISGGKPVLLEIYGRRRALEAAPRLGFRLAQRRVLAA
ncbi:MAG: hypothetical protein R3C52_15575 [Hyphomonadaceae bacterium]